MMLWAGQLVARAADRFGAAAVGWLLCLLSCRHPAGLGWRCLEVVRSGWA